MPGGSGLRNVVSRWASGREKRNDNATSEDAGTAGVRATDKPSSSSVVPAADITAAPSAVARQAGVELPPAKSKVGEPQGVMHLSTRPNEPGQTYIPVPILPTEAERLRESGVVCLCCEAFFHWVQAADRRTESSARTRADPGVFFHYSRYGEWEIGLAKGCLFCSFLHSICFSTLQKILAERSQPILTWFTDARGNDGSPLPDESVRANVTTESEPFRGRLGLSLKLVLINPEQSTSFCNV